MKVGKKAAKTMMTSVLMKKTVKIMLRMKRMTYKRLRYVFRR